MSMTACLMLDGIPQRVIKKAVIALALIGVVLSSCLPPGAYAAAQSVTVPQKATAQEYSALANALENPASRTAIINTLRQMAAKAKKNAPSSASVSTPTSNSTFASASNNISLSLLSSVKGFLFQWQQGLETSREALKSLTSPSHSVRRWEHVGQTTWKILVVALLAYGIFAGIQIAFRKWMSNRVSRSAERHSVIHLITSLVVAAAIAAVGIILGWSIGGAVAALIAAGPGAQIYIYSQFLQAFLWVEAIRQGVRLTLGSQGSVSAFLLPTTTYSQTLASGLSWLALLLGYTFLWLAPILINIGDKPLSQAIEWLVALAAFFVAVKILRTLRSPITQGLSMAADQSGDTFRGWALRVLARSWLVLSIAYLLLVLAALLLRPEDILPFIGRATLTSLASILVASLLLRSLRRWAKATIRIHPALQRSLPALELRLNQFQPYVISTCRVVIIVCAAAAILNAWGVTNVLTWFSAPLGQSILERLIGAVSIAAIALLIWVIADSMIEARLQGEGSKSASARLRTLLGLLRVVLAIVIALLAGMMALSQLGMDVGPLIAGTSVLGLAVGFGSQKLVQDVINGVFIQVENAINVGDVITVGNITGTAEVVSIRSVRIRDLNGTYHIVPYSAVNEVSNYTYKFANFVGVYGIAYSADIDDAVEKLKEAFEDLISDKQMQAMILEPITIHGVIALNSSSVDIRIAIKTTPGNQWAVGRAYTRLVKIHFDRAGIEIPFPQQTIWFGSSAETSAHDSGPSTSGTP